MKTVIVRKGFSLILTVAVLATVSCGSTAPSADTTVSSSDNTEPAVSTESYVYPEINLSDDEFTILNTAQTYSFYTTLDVAEQTGESVDDAIYARNRSLEERFHFKMVINEDYTLEKAAAALQTAVLAGDDLYDAAFLRDYYLTTVLSEGYLIDMQDYDEFHFDEAWWDGAATEESRIGNKRPLYYAYTDISLADFEGTIVNFINEDYLADLKMEMPYDLVREGKWTLDRYAEYMKAGANINGNDTFDWVDGGTAKYGMTTWDQGETALVIASGCSIISLEKNQPVVAANTEKFINVAQKVISLCSIDGDYIFLNGSGNDNYEMMFKMGRSLMLLAQLKATNKYRDMTATYGIVPIPKWDETQEEYRNLRSYCYVMCMPVVNSRSHETAAIMDAMSYLTYRDVMVPFYNGRVCQKALRNDDSIEMLEIIRSSRCIDLGVPYGWSSQLRSAIHNAMKNKSTDIASTLASLVPTMEENIQKTMENLN